MKKCPLCNHKQYKVVYIVDHFRIVECTKCGLVRTLDSIQMDYSSYHRDTDYQKHEKQFKNIFRMRYNLLTKYKRSGRVLDIGTSTGAMLDIFKENAWVTWGIEPSLNAQIARDKGHKIINTSFENAKLKSNYFDAVILNHTLEHVGDPLKIMDKVSKILKKDGVVLVDVPNFNSFSRNILKNNWPYILPNEHTFHFTPTTLTKIVEKSGFKVIKMKSRSGIFEYANPFSELWEALKGMKKRFFTDLFGFPGAIFSTVLNKGTSFSLVAIKR